MIIKRGDGRYIVDKEVCDSDIRVELSLHEINDMLESLHEAERSTIHLPMHYYEEWPTGEIAGALEIPEPDTEKMLSSIITRCKSFIHGKE